MSVVCRTFTVLQAVNSYATVAQPVASERRIKRTGHGISSMNGLSMHGISKPHIAYDMQDRSEMFSVEWQVCIC